MANGTIKQPMQDTGWISLNANLRCRKIGNIVYLYLIQPPISTDTWQTIGTLPVGYRPYTTLFTCTYYSSGTWMTVRIFDNGEVKCNGNSAFDCQVSFALG